MKSCDKCGAANRDTADFCSLCMAPFTAGAGQAGEATHTAEVPGSGQIPNTPQPPGQASSQPVINYDKPQAGVTPYDDTSVTDDAPGSRPGVPPTVASVSDALRERNTELLSSMELFNEAFFFWWENVKFYFLYGIAVILAVIALFNLFISSAGSTLTAAAAASPEQAAGSMMMTALKFFFAVGLLYLIVYAALITGTVKLAQGYGAGVINSTLGGLINLKSIVWIIFLQGLATAIIMGPISFIVAASTGGGSNGQLLNSVFGGPIFSLAGAPFTMAIFVFLDQDIRGIRALSTAIQLVGTNWLRVMWRFLAFGIFITLLLFGTQMHPLGAALALFFAPGMSIIYPWFIYQNLKKMKEAKEYKAMGTVAPTALNPA